MADQERRKDEDLADVNDEEISGRADEDDEEFEDTEDTDEEDEEEEEEGM